MVEIGDLLLAMYGATSGDIAISKIKGAINQAILCIRTNQNKKFIESVWNKHVSKILRKYLQGGQGNLSADIVKGISFSFPTLEEQERIANLISLLDERIATQNKVIDKLQSLIKGLNDTLYAQHSDEVMTSFAELGTSYSGLSGKSAQDFGSGKPFITYLNVYSNNIINKMISNMWQSKMVRNRILSNMAMSYSPCHRKRQMKLVSVLYFLAKKKCI